MRKLIIILFVVKCLCSVNAQNDFILKGKPKTLDECFMYLDSKLDSKTIEILKTTAEDSLYNFHFGLGMWIRNHLGLWKNSDLAKYFAGKGIFHPDDMSHIIIVSYHRYLNKEDINLKEQIESCQAYYKNIYYVPIIDSNFTRKTGDVSFGLCLGWGHYGQLKDLKKMLNTSPYPTVDKTYSSCLLSVSLHKNRLFFNGDFSYNFATSTDTSKTFRSDFSSHFLKFDLAYDIYRSRNISYLAFAGMGLGGYSLNLWSPVTDSVSWDNISYHTNNAEIDKSPVFTIDCGIGIRSTSNSICHWDLKLGYSKSIYEGEWYYNKIKFGKEPMVNLSGIFLKISGYINVNEIMKRS